MGPDDVMKAESLLERGAALAGGQVEAPCLVTLGVVFIVLPR